MRRRRLSSMAPGIAHLIPILVGALAGMFFVALVRSGDLMPLNGLSFLSLLLAVLIVLRLLAAGDKLFVIGGVVVGALLVVLIPALSPAQLSSDQLLLALIVLILALRL